MVNYDKNVQGAKREQARQAHEAKVKAKQDKEAARREAAKAKRDRQLLESIAEQIDQSEEHAYGQVYSELCHEDEPPSVVDPQVLNFLASHTDINVQGGGERLADALRQVLAPAEDTLQFPQFLELLRENAVADSTAVSKFLETCRGHDSVAKTECAAHALHVAQKMVSITFEKEKWDVLLQAVMRDMEHMLSLQDFVQICKKLSRCARLLQFLEVEAQEDLPALSGKGLKQWKALSEDISARLQQQPGLRGPRQSPQEIQEPFLSEQLEAIAECSPEGADSTAKCDLCKAGICAYHTQRAPAKGPGSKNAAQVRVPPSNKLEARQGLEEAMTSLADLVLQLEDAILEAFDAGLEEDELLPAFKRLEELRGWRDREVR
ncbi:unnamed protein product [Cladocopium goreaui]|uniref:Uncharacterized protein n=1 Tax=Cladocopium goreaui TaxID=2562237 RepID=A0A9P1CPU9_9DINO|nr:unnamed protein product [Cladocopium goreaui]